MTIISIGFITNAYIYYSQTTVFSRINVTTQLLRGIDIEAIIAAVTFNSSYIDALNVRQIGRYTSDAAVEIKLLGCNWCTLIVLKLQVTLD